MQIAMLGHLEVTTPDGIAEVPGARLRGLLVALALHPGQVVSKGTLTEWIWGENPPAEATNALQRLASRLRKILPPGALEGLPEGYRLTIEPEAVDAVRFEQLVTESRSPATDVTHKAVLLREALGLRRSSPMVDVGLQDSARFDSEVARLEELHLTALEDWAEAEIVLGRAGELVAQLLDLAVLHPTRERLTATTMQALAAAGRTNEALKAFQRSRNALASELGVDPSPELSALHVSLLRGEGSDQVRTHNLRAELTSFVGRHDDLAEVRHLVTSHRLVTLIGPGGCGKTRLASESALGLADRLTHGAWLVELAPVGQGGDVAHAALAALGPRDTLLGESAGADPTARVIAAIGARDLLLILDNCEHLIEQAARFAHRVLGECPGLRILTTSREPLGITGEALWQVVPLAVPAENTDPEASAAVHLLRDRARAVRRDLAVDAATSETLARIARALDGVPLAIELAAARLRTMTPDQLADRLDDRFRLLTGGNRTALPRHRTLQAAIDWSWQLLSEDERRVLRRLSVFSGGAGLEAAEAVCADDQVLDLLTALTEKSLLVAEPGAGLRFRMLGTIREYAARKLDEAAETAQTRQAHLTFFTEFAEAAEPHLRRAEQLEWLVALQAEHDNISAAMRQALASEDALWALRLAAAAGWYWWLSGHKTEGSELLKAAAALPGQAPDAARAMVYALMAMFLNSGRGDERDAAEWIQQAHEHRLLLAEPAPVLELIDPLHRMLQDPAAYLSAFEPLLDSQDPWVRALARLHMGKVRVVLGHSGTEADDHLREALSQFRSVGERFGISFAHTELAARTATRGDFAAAREHYEQAITAVTELGAREDVITLRARQAHLHLRLGDPAAAAAVLAEAQRLAERSTWSLALFDLTMAKAAIARESGDPDEARRHLDLATGMLGEEAGRADFRALQHDLLAYLTRDPDEVRFHRTRAYRAALETGHVQAIAHNLVGIADLALLEGRPEQAARLLAAATELRGLPDLSNPDAVRIERAVAGLDASTGPAEGDWSTLAEATLHPLS
ncbi:BTAD domain-containing putative transcriptional regulator [Kineosporia babensis]|uniref:Winged helix-turn-helix domain-containing protein n=1 Tax=Kineosporia babensis TaxID=499548 RepID=A0A9X1NA70_9ACTN|nr:winged helix-turn-helix domain-containing protein [Kineosporia babensis]